MPADAPDRKPGADRCGERDIGKIVLVCHAIGNERILIGLCPVGILCNEERILIL